MRCCFALWARIVDLCLLIDASFTVDIAVVQLNELWYVSNIVDKFKNAIPCILENVEILQKLYLFYGNICDWIDE